MIGRLQRLNTVFMLFFGVAAAMLVYLGVLGAPQLLARDDNPRLVEAELRVQRGRILDRDGVVLAETVGELGELERVYSGAGVYSPAVGYYSLRHGVGGVEGSYDEVLRGGPADGWSEWWDGFVHRYPTGRDLHLTLDAGAQAVADAALGEQRGAVVLLDARNGEILALVSHPGYDPNLLDEQFDLLNGDENAPLLNRATQALYQPGTALQPLLLAAGLEQGMVEMGAPVEGMTRPVEAGDDWLTCLSTLPPESATITTALTHSCPAPFVELGVELGAAGLVEGLANLGLFDSSGVPLEEALSSRPELGGDLEGIEAEAAGQGELTLSPLQMAWAVAAIANEGELPALQLVRRIGEGELVLPAAVSRPGISAETARAVTQAMVEGVTSGAAGEAAIEGVEVAGHVGMAVAGPGGERNRWFVGFAPATIPRPFARYVVVVLLEGAAGPGVDDPSAAARVGRVVLESVVAKLNSTN